MLTQNEAIMCLEAITAIVLTDKILHDGDEELVSNDERCNWEMNEEIARGNFVALWTIMSEEDRKAFLEKLRNFK